MSLTENAVLTAHPAGVDRSGLCRLGQGARLLPEQIIARLRRAHTGPGVAARALSAGGTCRNS